MFKVEKVNACGNVIYPDKDYLADYAESDIGSFVSTLAVESMIGQSVWQLGDSGVFVKIIHTGERGEEGMLQFKESTECFIRIASEALAGMSAEYRKCYEHFIQDAECNGLCMPGRKPFKLNAGVPKLAAFS